MILLPPRRPLALATLAVAVLLGAGCDDQRPDGSMHGVITTDGEPHEIDVEVASLVSRARYEFATRRQVHGARIMVRTRKAHLLTTGSFPVLAGDAFEHMVEVTFSRLTASGPETTQADSGTLVVVQIPETHDRRWQGRLENVRGTFASEPETEFVAQDVTFTVEFSKESFPQRGF